MEKNTIYLTILSLALIWIYLQIPEIPEKPLGVLATPTKCVKISGNDGSEVYISIIKGKIVYSKPGSTTPECL